MIDLGNVALILVLVLTAFATLAGFYGGITGRTRFTRAGENAVVAAWGLCATSMGSLWYLLFTSDFRVEYVWAHSNRELHPGYKISSLWSGQEGSLLLWLFVALTYGALVVVLNRNKNRGLMPYVVGVMASSSFFFALLVCFVANPFNEIAFVHESGAVEALKFEHLPEDGNGLNPLLQHPAMGIHPPILYGGYVGFLVPFAFCIAALATRRLGDAWIKTTRRWTLVAWALQGAGILLGARWAYVELGWGGYWAWDPVENASLMPWITATAFLHSVMIQEKKGMLKVWNIALVLLTYGLAIFGTFTTRSGIMSSVHAFAESSIGTWFVVYLVIMLVFTTGLLFTRLDHLKTENHFEAIVSRESAFLFNNLVLLAACFAVLWGTMLPVMSEALRGEKIVVGAPFFNRIETPLGLLLLFLTGVGPLIAWRKSSLDTLWKNLGAPFLFGIAVSAALAFGGMRHVTALIAFGLCGFVVATIVSEFYRGGRARARSIHSGFLFGLFDLVRRNKRRYGGYTVHFAFVVLIIGFAGKAFDTETKVPVMEGDTVSLRGYDLTVDELIQDDTTDPNYTADRMIITLSRDGKTLATLAPEARRYHASSQLMTEVARWGSFKEDVYTVFVQTSPDSPPDLQVYVNPLVRWVWIGGLLMALGTALTVLPDYRPGRLATTAEGS